jgi:phosphopantothenoylcysteine decarboxylase/phosphopantothenate--cysteine ligase
VETAQKNILLCITGGIAVYKAAALTSQVSQAGYNVKIMMTDSARQFVTPLTFQTLSRNHVYFDTFDEKDPAGVAHIDLADWADLVVVAPATANIIGKIANGIADNMISTTILATTAPVLIAPAMNVHMYEHPAVLDNMKRVTSFGCQFIEPGEGLLACGYVGKGRLAEPEEILQVIKNFFADQYKKPLKDKNVLVTAGPTREFVDPVRYFTNRSSGKMGYSLAVAALHLGANVTLISGPTSLVAPPGIEVTTVQSAQEMFQKVIDRFPNTDVVIKAAAVADYRPKHFFTQKQKKQSGGWNVEMERTTDILKALGERKQQQLLVGFAAETNNVEEYAKQKLEKKNLDMIVANNVAQENAGFDVDTNEVTLFKRSGKHLKLPLLSKQETATAILNEVINLLREKQKL